MTWRVIPIEKGCLSFLWSGGEGDIRVLLICNVHCLSAAFRLKLLFWHYSLFHGMFRAPDCPRLAVTQCIADLQLYYVSPLGRLALLC